MTTLHIRQGAPSNGHYPIHLTLKRPNQPNLEAEANIDFALTEHEQEELRWYIEDYLQHAEIVEAVNVQQVEELMKARGEELYAKVLAANADAQALWFSIRNDLADLRVEISTGMAETATIPWELMRDPKTDSAISLQVKSFVHVQSNPSISFVSVPSADDDRVRLLYIACRPSGARDVELRAVANRLLQDLGPDRARFDIKALRPPTFERLQEELAEAMQAGRPYHIVHFDGHGVYVDLSMSRLTDWATARSSVTLDRRKSGKHGYLLFEHPSDDKMWPVDGQTLGQLLHDNGVPILVLNACQSAMHEAAAAPKTAEDIHDEVRAIGSLAQAVVDQGIPAVLGMRYSVYVVTAAQYIGQLYASLASGRSFGQAATEGRKHLQLNPERWVDLQPRPLQDWFVPIAYEVAPIELCPAGKAAALGGQPELDPVRQNRLLLRYVPEEGFIGRDETILALDRAFDEHRVVLLHAYAGQGKSSTAVEFARWYSITGGLGDQALVLLASFENHTDLADLLNQVGQPFSEMLAAQGIDWSAINKPQERRQLVLQILRQIPILWIWDNVEPVVGFPEGTESQWTTSEQNDLRDFLEQIKRDTASQTRILLTSRRDEHSWLGGIPHRIEMPRMRNSDAAKLALKLGEEKRLERSEIADWQPLLDYCSGNPLTLRVLVGQAVKAGVRGKQRVADFVEAIRSGEQKIEDADEKQGRDKSLGASLDYGFRHAFKDDELPIVALFHLFQGTVDVNLLYLMGQQYGKGSWQDLPKVTDAFLAVRVIESAVTFEVVCHSEPQTLKIETTLQVAVIDQVTETHQAARSESSFLPIQQLDSFSRFADQQDGDVAPIAEVSKFSRERLADIMERAASVGLLTRIIASTYYQIHPALPWFLRQLYARHYDGQSGRSSSQAALRAWSEAVGAMADHYHRQFNEGNRRVIELLELEEANLLHARRLARRNQWWHACIACMQGLRDLYEYQGRTAEWARLVEEIRPDYCTSDNEPVPGREDHYSMVMGYRVALALKHEHDLAKAAVFQEKVVEVDRQKAAATLILPPDVMLDEKSRNWLRTVAMSLGTLGQILQETGDATCVQHYQECMHILRRIADKNGESISEFNLGHAYMVLPSIRDLDAAEAAYRRSLDLHDLNDTWGRSKCINQIGRVHHERFIDARKRKETVETLLRHAQAAEQHYLEGLRLCPKGALTDLAPEHNQLGTLYAEIGRADNAREHFEQAARYFERAGNSLSAGKTRFNMAIMYLRATRNEDRTSQQHASLLRARAYAEAALRDYQHYQGRAAEQEFEAQGLLDEISRALAKPLLPNVFLDQQLGRSFPWQPIYNRIAALFEKAPDHRLRLSEAIAISAMTGADQKDVFAVLNLLTAPEINSLTLEFREFRGAKATPVPLGEISEKLTRWWRNKSVSDEEWREWSSKIEVSWRKVHQEGAEK